MAYKPLTPEEVRKAISFKEILKPGARVYSKQYKDYVDIYKFVDRKETDTEGTEYLRPFLQVNIGGKLYTTDIATQIDTTKDPKAPDKSSGRTSFAKFAKNLVKTGVGAAADKLTADPGNVEGGILPGKATSGAFTAAGKAIGQSWKDAEYDPYKEPKSLTSKIKDRFGVDLYAKYKNAKYKKKS